MKKTTLAITMAISMLASLATAPKSNAGIVIMLNAHQVGGIYLGAGVATAGSILTCTWDPAISTIGLVLVILDTKAGVQIDQAKQALAKQFTFIDDQDLLTSLAQFVQSSVNASGELTDGMKLKTSASELNSILANSSLNADQQAQVAAAFLN